MAASAAAWRDEAHVESARALYRRRFAVAERLLGNMPGFRRPAGGFYVWLDVGDGAAFAKELWRRSGVKVMPGAFMAKETIPGDPTSNPGHSYVRIALVHDLLTITAALERVADLHAEGRMSDEHAPHGGLSAAFAPGPDEPRPWRRHAPSSRGLSWRA